MKLWTFAVLRWLHRAVVLGGLAIVFTLIAAGLVLAVPVLWLFAIAVLVLGAFGIVRL